MVASDVRLLQTEQIQDRELIIRENSFDAIHYFQIK